LIATGAGLIPAPQVAIPAALVGLASFLGYKQAERAAEKQQWYLLGAKIRELDLQRVLKKR